MSRKRKAQQIDVVGVGINATDTIIRLPHFPCQRLENRVALRGGTARGPSGHRNGRLPALGLAYALYREKNGDDAAGKFQVSKMAREGVQALWMKTADCSSQSSFILVDARSGERTVLWQRDRSNCNRPLQICVASR